MVIYQQTLTIIVKFKSLNRADRIFVRMQEILENNFQVDFPLDYA